MGGRAPDSARPSEDSRIIVTVNKSDVLTPEKTGTMKAVKSAVKSAVKEKERPKEKDKEKEKEVGQAKKQHLVHILKQQKGPEKKSEKPKVVESPTSTATRASTVKQSADDVDYILAHKYVCLYDSLTA